MPKIYCRQRQGIKTTFTWPVQQYLSCFLILDQKIKRVKFNEHVIVKSKFVDRYKVFGSSRDMENIIEDKTTRGCENNRRTNMRHLPRWPHGSDQTQCRALAW
jgi:hypothetical protein